jgi:penicillin-binding protein 1A
VLPKFIKPKRILKSLLYLIGGGISLILIFYFSVSFGVFGHIHSEEELLKFENELATTVLSSDNKTLGRFYSKNREKVFLDSVPRHLLNCLVATEDSRYYKHKGVDVRSLLRVLFKSLFLGNKSSGGGSTITQQLAKNMYGRSSYGILTMPVIKCKEMILASRLEAVYSKDEILALYLNTIPFGENIYGIQAASKRFFNKRTQKLKIEECAVLIGMLKANSYYNPRLNPNNAFGRRNVVLYQAMKSKYITQQELDSLKSFPLKLYYMDLNRKGPANYFLNYVRKEANEILETYNDTAENPIDLESDGLTIKTTLNYQLHAFARESYKEHLSYVQKHLRKQYKRGNSRRKLDAYAKKKLKRMGVKNVIKNQNLFSWEGFYVDSISTLDSIKYALTQLHGGYIAMSPKSGAIKSWIGGVDFSSHPYDQVTAKRQLASTFKPLLYAAAIENGKRACDYISNEEIRLTDYKDWSPENYDHTSGGKYSVAAALANSKNIPAVRLYFETGFKQVNKLWQNMKFISKLEDQPSLALGTATASALELAQAYASFANGGKEVNAYSISEILDKNGKLLYKVAIQEEPKEIIEETTADVVCAVLKKAVNEGTGTALIKKYRLKIPFAGKTGTSQNFSDAWFVGFNPKIIMVSRVGSNSPSIHFNSGSFGSGSRLALPIVGATLAKAVKDRDCIKLVDGEFTSEVDEVNLDCIDYIGENKVDLFFKKFQKKKLSLEDEKSKAKRRKRNPLRRLLKW